MPGDLRLYLKLAISTPCGIPSYEDKFCHHSPGGSSSRSCLCSIPGKGRAEQGRAQGQSSRRLAAPAAIMEETAARLSPTTACPPSSFTQDNYLPAFLEPRPRL